MSKFENSCLESRVDIDEDVFKVADLVLCLCRQDVVYNRSVCARCAAQQIADNDWVSGGILTSLLLLYLT